MNAMVKSEREMVRALEVAAAEPTERFTSLQPTYEDSVPSDAKHEWDAEWETEYDTALPRSGWR